MNVRPSSAVERVFERRMEQLMPEKRHAAATGLDYNYFGNFDPAVGGYSQNVPWGLKSGVSTFAPDRAR